MALQARVPFADVSNGLNQLNNQAKNKAFAVKPLLSGNEKRRRDPSPRRISSGRDRRSQGKAPVAKPRQAREERDDRRLRERLRKRDGFMGPVQDCLMPSLPSVSLSSIPGQMLPMYDAGYADFEYPYVPQCQFLEDMSCPQVWSWDPCLDQGMAPEYAFQPQPQPRAPEVREERRQDDKEAFLYPGHPAYNPIDVTVKNTFIDLPAPRTPSPNSKSNAKTPVAKTCPPKYAMGAFEREQWEEDRAEAEEAAALFEGKERAKAAPTFNETTSVGSLLHRAGLCKPCAWFHHAKGCQRGVRCEFCHCCPPGEIKKRKKEKTVLIRKRRTQQHGFTDDYAKACPLVPQYELPQCW